MDSGWEFDIVYLVESDLYEVKRAIGPKRDVKPVRGRVQDLPMLYREVVSYCIDAIESEKAGSQICFGCRKRMDECECKGSDASSTILNLDVKQSLEAYRGVAHRVADIFSSNEIVDIVYDGILDPRKPLKICPTCRGSTMLNYYPLTNNAARFIAVLVNEFLKAPRWYHYREDVFKELHIGNGGYALAERYQLARRKTEKKDGWYKPTVRGAKFVLDPDRFRVKSPMITYQNNIVGWGTRLKSFWDALGTVWGDETPAEYVWSEDTLPDALLKFQRDKDGMYSNVPEDPIWAEKYKAAFSGDGDEDEDEDREDMYDENE